MGVTHKLVTVRPDSGVAGEVSANAWNDNHDVDASGVLLGRVTAGPGAIEALSAATAKTLLAIAIGDVAGLAAALSALTSALAGLAPVASSGSASDLTSGTLSAARLPALTGDVTTSAGSAATAIAGGAVTNAKLAPAPAGTLKGNATGGSAAPTDLTASQAKTLLAIAAGDVSGLAAVATSASAADLTGGTLSAARLPGLSGDVTSSAGSAATTIAASSVSNAKLANAPAATIKGNSGGSPAAPSDLTATQAKALLAIVPGDVAGLATIASSGSATDLIAGTVPTARLAALTGDVTSSAGSAATTIAGQAVTNGKLAAAPTLTIKGNATGGSASPADLTASQAKAVLAITASDVSGLAAIASSGSATDLTAGAVPAARMPAHTGDVTSSAGSVALTIAAAAVTNAKLANANANTLKGNNTGSSATPADLTTSQVKTLLAIAASDVSGLATIATSGSASDLGAGTVPAARMPAHTGDVTSSAGAVALTIANDAVTYAKMQNVSATQRALGRNTAGAGDPEEVTASQLLDWVSSTQGVLLTRGSSTWAAIANVASEDGDLTFTEHAPTTTPASGKGRLFGSSSGGRQMLGYLGPTGAKMMAQPFLGQQHAFQWIAGLNNTVTAVGLINPTIITATGRTIDPTTSFTAARRVGSVSPSTSAAACGIRNTTAFLHRQQGFHIVLRAGISDAVITTTGRFFIGIQAAVSAPTDTNPSGFANIIGIGTDSSGTALVLFAAGSAAQSSSSLTIATGPNAGGSFPANTTNTDVYELGLYCGPSGNVTWQVVRVNTGDAATGTISVAAQLPAVTTLLTPQIWRSNGATAAAVGVDLFSMYGDTDL